MLAAGNGDGGIIIAVGGTIIITAIHSTGIITAAIVPAAIITADIVPAPVIISLDYYCY